MTLSRDQTLVHQALLGSREAAERLAEEHLRPAFGIAFALTGSVADSEDVVQEAFLRAFRGLIALRGQDFGPWLAGIVRRVAADLARDRGRASRARASLSERARARADSASGPEAAEREEEERLLREELAALPEGLRLPLVLFYFEEQSTARVASHLGLRPAAARHAGFL